MVSLSYSMIISDISNVETARVEARAEFEKRLVDYKQTSDILKGVKPQAEPFKLSPAMMAQMGIPVMSKPRPKPVEAQESQ
jgi:hypothetical protein